jgi:hypothetical protein
MRSLASQEERGKTKQFIFVVYRYNRRLGTNNIGFKKRVQNITEIRMVKEFKAIYVRRSISGIMGDYKHIKRLSVSVEDCIERQQG